MALQIQLQKDDTIQTVEVEYNPAGKTSDELTSEIETALSGYDYDIYVILGEV